MARRKGSNGQDPNNVSVEDLNAFINSFFSEIIENSGLEPGPGNVYRFDVKVNKEGITITPNSSGQGQVQSMKTEDREPLVDVIDGKDGVTVISELPLIPKKDIEIHADHERLSIKAKVGKQTYSRLVPLPSMVDPSTAAAVYNNGVLEVSLKRSNTYSSIVKIDVK